MTFTAHHFNVVTHNKSFLWVVEVCSAQKHSLIKPSTVLIIDCFQVHKSGALSLNCVASSLQAGRQSRQREGSEGRNAAGHWHLKFNYGKRARFHRKINNSHPDA